MEESQTEAVAVKVDVPDLYPKMRDSLARGVATLEQRLRAIDANKDGAEVEAQDVVARAREAADLVTKAAEKETRPFRAAVDVLIDRWNPLKKAFEQLRTLGKNKAQEALYARQKREAEARRVEQAKLDEARRLEALAASQAKAEATPAAQEAHTASLGALRHAREAVDALPPAGAPVGVVTGSGSLKPATRWDFEVVDVDAVPKPYMKVDHDAVRAAIAGKDGLREIPGLRIFAVETLVDRRPSRRGQKELA